MPWLAGRASSSVLQLPASSVAPALSPSRQSPRERLAASEENREACERSSPQSPALPALYVSPPSSPELLPVCVDPVQGVESIRVSPLLLGEKTVDSAGQETRPVRGHPCEIVALS